MIVSHETFHTFSSVSFNVAHDDDRNDAYVSHVNICLRVERVCREVGEGILLSF